MDKEQATQEELSWSTPKQHKVKKALIIDDDEQEENAESSLGNTHSKRKLRKRLVVDDEDTNEDLHTRTSNEFLIHDTKRKRQNVVESDEEDLNPRRSKHKVLLVDSDSEGSDHNSATVSSFNDATIERLRTFLKNVLTFRAMKKARRFVEKAERFDTEKNASDNHGAFTLHEALARISEEQDSALPFPYNLQQGESDYSSDGEEYLEVNSKVSTSGNETDSSSTSGDSASRVLRRHRHVAKRGESTDDDEQEESNSLARSSPSYESARAVNKLFATTIPPTPLWIYLRAGFAKRDVVVTSHQDSTFDQSVSFVPSVKELLSEESDVGDWLVEYRYRSPQNTNKVLHCCLDIAKKFSERRQYGQTKARAMIKMLSLDEHRNLDLFSALCKVSCNSFTNCK